MNEGDSAGDGAGQGGMQSGEGVQQTALARAVAQLLQASGLDLEHKDLVRTPQRVAALWSEHFLSGYQMNPAAILGDVVEGEGPSELVVLRDLPYHGMCPHHLMPYAGAATIAYLPGTQLVGFGRLHDLLECFTRRLTLQERACNDVVDALMDHLDARGAGCVMVGRHNCLAIPDNKHGATVQTASFRGALRDHADLQASLLR